VKIYLDNCCLNRPYDDFRDDIVRMEAEAVISIIDRCENGGWELCGSDVLLDEIENTPNLVKKQKVLLLYQSAATHIDLNDEILSRAEELEQFNIKPYDALHLASAEAGGANVFLTTDKKLIGAAARARMQVKVENPLIWLMEVLYNER
jgi:predicted nucleic acid-binding protein